MTCYYCYDAPLSVDCPRPRCGNKAVHPEHHDELAELGLLNRNWVTIDLEDAVVPAHFTKRGVTS